MVIQGASAANLFAQVRPQSGGAPNVLETKSGSNNPNELTEEEEKVVAQMKQRDAEVRAHEQAHKTAGGPYASAPTYTFEDGPDGRQYAVAGEVKIDASAENTPEQTIRKMDVVIRAALAPAEPSPQDRAVAAQASATRIQAQQELAAGKGEGGSPIQEFIQEALEAYKKGNEISETGQRIPKGIEASIPALTAQAQGGGILV